VLVAVGRGRSRSLQMRGETRDGCGQGCQKRIFDTAQKMQNKLGS